MRILISIGVISSFSSYSEDRFILQLIRWLARRHPEHSFLIAGKFTLHQNLQNEKNISFIKAGTSSASPVIWKWWYDVKIPAVIRKCKADIFITCDNCCSLRTEIPQFSFLTNTVFLSHPELYKKTQQIFYKKYFSRFLHLSKQIFLFSGADTNKLIAFAGNNALQTCSIPAAPATAYKPLDDAEKTQIKEKHTQGCEYFLYAGHLQAGNNLMNLLKAFSVFKKMQRSNMKLVFALQNEVIDPVFTKNLETYRYRKDVITVQPHTQQDWNSIIGAAYAAVFPSVYENSAVGALETIQCGIPVLASSSAAIQEQCGDSVLCFNPQDYPEIAAQMMLIYKDENLRRELIEKGKIITARYSVDKSAQLLWQAVAACMP